MSDTTSPSDLIGFERLALAIAHAVERGPRDPFVVPDGAPVEAVIVNYAGIRVQLLRSHDIQIDDWSYRCRVLKADPE